jgi:glutamate dehydrogenase
VTIAEAALSLKERRATRLFVRHDQYQRFLSCLVYLPRDRYTTDVRLRIQEVLREAIGGASVDYTARVTESVLARLHIVVRMPRGQAVPADVDVAALEARIAEVVRSWDDHLAAALLVGSTEAAVHQVLRRYPQGFPEAYRAVTSPAEAVADLAAFERLSADEPLRVSLQPATAGSGGAANARLKLYSLRDISLAEVLPVLSSLGVQVVTEQPYRFVRTTDEDQPGGAFLFDFGLRATGTGRLGQVRTLWEQAFVACWDGRAEADGFNALVAEAGLDWRRIWVLRAYARYLRQAGSAFSQQYIEGAALANPRIASLLVQLFHARFDPDLVGDRAAQCAALSTQITRALDDVASLDQDRILRGFLGLIEATLRTNHFQADRPALAVKLEPRRIRDLPEPRPHFEIWVQSPQVEGVHLRFGKVARGGLRWSDRPEDFRTEILGLVKAQAVKNAVIVPVGAKGGFFAKQLPDPSDREAWLAEGIASYRTFIGSLLDVTDNLVGTEVVPPARVVRHDEDDPYLVVAADKGTATFSDIANGVAAQYGFWLGDAFASGGSAGYDHKAMGITARGAWESVKAHFRVIGPDIAVEPFTCVGIGDMSGDVFGNGMLLSSTMRLVAAFDHRHIFLDPDPDPAAAFAERQRLFRLPRSSWADYAADLVSPGGGVHPRTAKAIPVSARMAEVLGLPGPATMAPNELLRAILAAPVDLLWNGGIGTYVKASTEGNAEVGDRANDAIRVNGAQLRCRVVGEGGNLGLTQRGRIEAARAGVRLNTDAIDNSAGVDTSDHEVNLKILLDRAIAAGQLDPVERDPLLRSMTDEVAADVLADNIDQNILLAFELQHATSMLPALGRLMRALERTAGLDRALEALPDDAALAALAAEGAGLTSPELAVLVAYTKLDLKRALLDSAVPDEPFTEPWLHDYVPAALRERFAEGLAAHPLRRQIITTGLVNELVNRGGITFALRAAEESGAGPAEIARAFAVSCGVFDLPDLWRRIDAQEGQAPTTALNALRAEVQRLLDRATRWLLQTRGGTLDVPGEVQRFRGTVEALAAQVPTWLVGVERERLDRRTADFVGLGAPADLAGEVAALLDIFSLLDIVEVSRRTNEDPAVVGGLYFTISERYEVDRFLGRITALPRGDRWAALARSALRSDLYGALALLTARVVRATPDGGPPAARAEIWEERYAEGLGRARATLAEIGQQETFDLATLSVAMRVIRTLAQQGG